MIKSKESRDEMFKAQLDSLSYDEILDHRFADLIWCRHGDDFGQPTLSCTFTMDIKVWKSYRDISQLGGIYNCDISNYLARKGILNEYCVPIVSDRKPARKGRKTINIEFRLAGHPYRP